MADDWGQPNFPGQSIYDRPPRHAATLVVGGPAINEPLGWEAVVVEVDNGTNQPVYIPDVDRYVAPFTNRVIAVSSSVASAFFQAQPGLPVVAPINGQKAKLIWWSADRGGSGLVPSPGPGIPTPGIDINAADIQPVGGTGHAGLIGIAADAGHLHPGQEFVVDVAPYNVGTDAARINAACADAAAAFGAGLGAATVTLGRRLYNLPATVFVPYGVRVRGQGRGATLLSGSGIILVQMNAAQGGGAGNQASLCELRDLTITDPLGNANTIGLVVQRKVLGVVVPIQGWAIRHLEIIGTAQLGIGLLCDFGLEGAIEDVTTQFWNIGEAFVDNANANTHLGGRIRNNNTGMTSDATVVDVFLFGTTIEGNVIGIDSAAINLCPVGCHFENTFGVAPNPTNIHIGAGGTYRGSSNGFYGAAAGRDIAVDAGVNGRHSSFGDHFSSGCFLGNAPAAGGFFSFYQPTGVLDPVGTGPALRYSDTTIVATNCGARNLGISGPFNLMTIDSGIHATGAGSVGTFDGGVGLDTVGHSHGHSHGAHHHSHHHTLSIQAGAIVTAIGFDAGGNLVAAAGPNPLVSDSTDATDTVPANDATGESVQHTHKG